MVSAQDPSDTSATLFGRLFDPKTKEEAWNEFVGRYQPLIVGWCLRERLQATDADDVAQAILCKLFRHLNNFVYDPSRTFRAYLRRMVSNEVKDLFSDLTRPGYQGRGNSRVADLLEQVVDSGALDGLAEEFGSRLVSNSLLASAIKQVRPKVKPRTWNAFWLAVMEEWPPREVAARLGLQVASVYQAKRRVLKLLEEALRGP
jgi:RNA polymerase sigma-70 factor (ECF subfamily)